MKSTDKLKANKRTELDPTQKNEGSRTLSMAELSLSPIFTSLNTTKIFAQGTFGKIDIQESMQLMRADAKKITDGDLSSIEERLISHATALDAMFNELARRAALNMGQNLDITERYLRLAFKAQAQCRTTLETLAEVKYPKAATFVRQQNVAYQQQVNNGSTNV